MKKDINCEEIVNGLTENISIELTNDLQNNTFKCKVTAIFKGFGSIILYLLVLSLMSASLNGYIKSENKMIAELAILSTYLISFLVLGIIYHKVLIKDLEKFKKENVKIAFKNWILGFGFMVISNIFITTFLGNIPENEALNREFLISYPISNIISMVIIGPLIEEITFRYAFKKGFNKWYTFALFTGLVFGLAHIAKFELLEFLFVIPYGALGFFFAKAMYETDNIYTSFIAHAIHNFLCVTTILLIR